VGRDNIGDFVTNPIQDLLCRYTEVFARDHLSAAKVRDVPIDRAHFNYETESWQRRTYRLPWYEDDFIILTPKDVLTRDDTWINRRDMIAGFDPALSSADRLLH
jgi:hypothetical protein